MGLREWIIVLAILLMVAVAFDAWRRVRHQRRYHGSWVKPRAGDPAQSDQSALRVSRVKGKPIRTEPSIDEPGPASGSRSGAGAMDTEATESIADAPSFNEPAKVTRPEVDTNPRSSSTDQRGQPGVGPSADEGRGRRPEGATRRPLDLSKKVPVLVDSLEPEAEEAPESEFDATDETQYEFDLQPPDPASSKAARSERSEYAPDAQGAAQHENRASRDPEMTVDPDDVLLSSSAGSMGSDTSPQRRPADEQDMWPDETNWQAPVSADPEFSQSPTMESRVDAEDHWEDEDIEDPVLAEAESRQLNDEEAGEQLLSEPEMVLVVTVLAREGVAFEGANLLSILLACGMRFGNMNIFHATDDNGRLQYSAANAFNPGTFDLDNVEHFETRGVTFFLQLPCQGNPLDAFDAMMHSANTLATHLDGDVYDESRSVMTTQTLTHYRERIREHQRAQLVKRA